MLENYGILQEMVDYFLENGKSETIVLSALFLKSTNSDLVSLG